MRALRLEDIDWAKNQILFKASKHGKDSRLPLTAQVGESLLDYLQHSRPSLFLPSRFSDLPGTLSPFGSFQLRFGYCGAPHPGCGHRDPQQGGSCLSALFCHPNAPSGSFAEGHCRRARPSPSRDHLPLYQGRLQRPETSGLGMAAGGVTMSPWKLHSSLARRDPKLHQSAPPLRHRLSKSGATVGILRPLSV